MRTDSALEQRLLDLITAFRNQREANQTLHARLEEKDRRISDLETKCEAMRLRIDELGKDRFTLKQLRDERKTIRKKLETALTRLDDLEQELAP